MPQVAILNGIYSDPVAELRTSYPRNLIPVPKVNGVSSGYLRPADGIEAFSTGQGPDRGGIEWKGTCYRVSGSKLISLAADGAATVLGDVGAGGPVTMDYGFDRLGIASGDRLYYWDGASLSQVTDPDLGTVRDVVWVDGYFMTTDGSSLVVTELNNPSAVNPLKYGSSEADPDSVMALLKVRTEIHAVNRYSIEVFNNIGGPFFPFQRIEGAQVRKGAIGTHAACVFEDAIAFVGSGRNEAPSAYIAINGQTAQIATREIDTILRGYSADDLAGIVVEARADKSHRLLLVHLPDQTLAYDAAASKALQEPVWFTLTSSIVGRGQYRARGLVWCYGKWIAGDPTGPSIGALTDAVSSHYGQAVGWDFGTLIVYNAGKGAIVQDLELVALTGRAALGADPVVWASYSLDGLNWSLEKPIKAGKSGDTLKRLQWRRAGPMRSMRMQRFRGTSDCHASFVRLEVTFEALNG